MADQKISQLTGATTPLDGTEVLPIVQSGVTKKVANNDLRPKQIQSNATSGVLQVVGPAAAATRVMTTPDANFTAARSDADQTFTGNQRINGNIGVQTAAATTSLTDVSIDLGGTNGSNFSGLVTLTFAKGATWNGSDWIYSTGYADAKAYALSFSNGHIWYHANVGTQGTPVSFTQVGRLDNSGDFTISGAVATKASGTAWANPSDIRLKDSVVDYVKGLNELLQIQPRTWVYNGKGGTPKGLPGLGVVADEIEKVLPDTVSKYLSDAENTEFKKFDSSEIIWVLVNSVKELAAEIQAIKSQRV
jgi:hypothetical protein